MEYSILIGVSNLYSKGLGTELQSILLVNHFRP